MVYEGRTDCVSIALVLKVRFSQYIILRCLLIMFTLHSKWHFSLCKRTCDDKFEVKRVSVLFLEGLVVSY